MPHIYNRTSEKQRRQSLRSEMPKAEEILWSKLRRQQFMGYKFRRQYSIGPYIVDFYCASVRLAIEVDGDSHFQIGAQTRDQARQALIESYGIHFLRFTNGEVLDHLDAVLENIAGKLLEYGDRRHTPL